MYLYGCIYVSCNKLDLTLNQHLVQILGHTSVSQAIQHSPAKVNPTTLWQITCRWVDKYSFIRLQNHGCEVHSKHIIDSLTVGTALLFFAKTNKNIFSNTKIINWSKTKAGELASQPHSSLSHHDNGSPEGCQNHLRHKMLGVGSKPLYRMTLA